MKKQTKKLLIVGKYKRYMIFYSRNENHGSCSICEESREKAMQIFKSKVSQKDLKIEKILEANSKKEMFALLIEKFQDDKKKLDKT